MSTATINLSFPASFLKKVDAVAAREDRTRSELVRVALLAYMQQRERWESIFAYADRHLTKHGLKPTDVNRAIHEYRRRA